MSKTSEEELTEQLLDRNSTEKSMDENIGENVYNFVLNTTNEYQNIVNDEVLKYKREIDKISYQLKEKNLIINKLMIALSNQTQEMINLEKAYHALKQHVIKSKTNSDHL